MNGLDMALIGNCSVGSLIDLQATLTWACFPRFDSAPVFCSLLRDTDEYGYFAVDMLAEHINPESGERWSNFVQTFSMVGLINSAIRLSIRWDQAF